MEKVKIIEVKQSIFAANNQEAEETRRRLKNQKTYMINLMASPGAGKTTLLCRTIEALKDEMKIGVM
ncbi:MAG: hydrogenase accessory protein HypB, partial [Oscillospiraceae bacterium]|nr:hydrogenase accessory protein HypB [Oscillospiraceae bacterium]